MTQVKLGHNTVVSYIAISLNKGKVILKLPSHIIPFAYMVTFGMRKASHAIEGKAPLNGVYWSH